MFKKLVCPWWLGYFMINPLRRFIHDPAKILSPYIKEGMTVVEPGPGMGFFTLELANKVGASGRVIAVEIQAEMLEKLKRRALKARVLERIDTRLVRSDTMGLTELDGAVDFVFAFAVVHEFSNVSSFFGEISKTLKSDGYLLLVEPIGHVTVDDFESELRAAVKEGLGIVNRPCIKRSHAALLKKL